MPAVDEMFEARQAVAIATWWSRRRNVRLLPWRNSMEPLPRRAMVEGLLAQTGASTVSAHYERVFHGVNHYVDWLALVRSEQIARVAPLGLPRLKADAVTGIATWGVSPQPRTEIGSIQAFRGVGPYTEAIVLTLHGVEAVPVDCNVMRVGARASCDGDAERWMAVLLGFAHLSAELAMDEVQPPLYQLTSAVLDIGAGPCDPDMPDCDRCPLGQWLCPTSARRSVQLCIPSERYPRGPTG